MSKSRRNFTADQKAEVVRRHLRDRVSVGVAPTIDTGSADFVVSVFSNDTLTSTQAATIRVTAVPEPNALGLALLGGFGLVIRRRSRACS
jgi:transposase-like protein